MSGCQQIRIVLLAGPVRERGPAGHHDYVAGCRLLADILVRVGDIDPVVIENGWPEDTRLLDHASAVLIYDGGNGKQTFLREPARLERLRSMIANGTGLVMLHQAVAFPAAYRDLSEQWLGGAYVPGRSQRGHWKSAHETFPKHPVTRGLAPWRYRDGWLKSIQFTADRSRITPLLWSAKGYSRTPSPDSEENVVAWLHERVDGGRSFAFTGVDNHRALRHHGLRRLLVNGLLWTAGQAPPHDADWDAMDVAEVKAYTTPRRSWLVHKLGRLMRVRRRSGKW